MVVCAVAPATLWLWERLGWWSVVGEVVVGGLVDLVSIGPDRLWMGSPQLPGGLGHRAAARIRVAQRAAGRHATSGGPGRHRAVGLVALVSAGPYPVSMIGLDDAVVNDSYPTRVALAFLGMLQAGVVLALEPAGALDGATAGLGRRRAQRRRPDRDAALGTSQRWCR